MKLFIPAVGYRIRLTQDWSFNLYTEHRNKTMFDARGLKFEDHWGGYRDKMKSVPVSVDSGTILEVDRVYVRTMSKSATTKEDDYDSVTFKVVGAATKIRFWAKLEDVNNIDYELPPDHTASKDQAKAKAKAPKKLSPAAIQNIISDSFYVYRGKTAPKWLTNALKNTFGDMAREYEARQRPLDLENLLKQQEAQESEQRHRFNCGALNIPVGLASIIKTYEDYKTHVQNNNNFYPHTLNERTYKADYFIPHVLLRRYGTGACTFSRDRDDQSRSVRRFTWKAEDRDHWRHRQGEADMSDMWLEAVSNAEDTEIVEVRAGFTKAEVV